jgi:hypothetical protein
MKIRVVNPSGSGPRRRKRRNPNTGQSGGTGGVFIVAKSKKRRSSRRRIGGSSRRRSSNPFGFGGGRVKRHRSSRRRRNPGFGGFGVRDLTGTILWGTAGALAARVVPSTFLGNKNTGFLGYGANGATAVIGGMLVGKFLNPRAGQEFTAGGLIALGLRLFEDWMGGGSSSDMGFYIENSFPVPTAGQGPYLLNSGYNGSPMASIQASQPAAALPAAAMAAAASGSGDEPNRWSKWA